jgi:uncharacterized lipoprotein YajG
MHATFNRRTATKLTLFSIAIAMLVLGCSREPQVVESPSPPPAESKAVSDGVATWQLGAATMNGTNIASSNITIRAVTNRAVK